MKKENLILDRSFDFAVETIYLYQALRNERHWDIGRQVLKCGTSIGANVHEATAAQSRPDFISKMSIASKEAREVNYWLRLIKASGILPVASEKMLLESSELVNILTAIVKTSQTS